MQKEQPFRPLCAFLAQQDAQKTQEAKVREQLDHALSKKVYKQEVRIDQLSFVVIVLSVLCACQFLYMLTL